MPTDGVKKRLEAIFHAFPIYLITGSKLGLSRKCKCEDFQIINFFNFNTSPLPKPGAKRTCLAKMPSQTGADTSCIICLPNVKSVAVF